MVIHFEEHHIFPTVHGGNKGVAQDGEYGETEKKEKHHHAAFENDFQAVAVDEVKNAQEKPTDKKNPSENLQYGEEDDRIFHHVI